MSNNELYSPTVTVNAIPSVVTLVQNILQQAIQQKASDIHFELYANSYRIRFRINGMLTEHCTPPYHYAERITLHIKILTQLDIAEHRLPQEGRFTFTGKTEHAIDCRVSIYPTIHGEKIVIRLLNATIPPDIDTLAFSQLQKQQILNALTRTRGMILVTGPTGSGKTTTLYAMLQYLNQQHKNIITLEDPVELIIPGINQTSINPNLNLDFNTLLKACLRQDPDIVMIGEIRDLATATTAIDAAFTGHLVLSTLHTNGTAETLSRLMHLGVAPFNICDAVCLIITQRLIRKLCEHDINMTHCPQCIDGYCGRIALFEVMPITTQIRQSLLSQHDSSQIRQLAEQDGMVSLYQSGLTYVQAGLTTLAEVNAVCK